MKKQFLLFVFLMSLIYAPSYSQNVSADLKENPDKKARKKIKSSIKFQEQLTTVALESIHISNGLQQGDIDSVREFAVNVMNNLSQVENYSLSYKSHFPWYLSKMKLALRLKRIYNAADLEDQKVNFDEFNRELYKTLIAYGLRKEKLYYLGCFEAFDNKSGYWFNVTSSISNPYLVEQNIECGFIAATIK